MVKNFSYHQCFQTFYYFNALTIFVAKTHTCMQISVSHDSSPFRFNEKQILTPFLKSTKAEKIVSQKPISP